MSDEIREAYERVPYDSGIHPQTHPVNLTTMAWLHGLESASPARCRVLELGCADGGNLLAMAGAAPESTFVGLDFVPSQIEAGTARMRELGLTNVELRTSSIMDIDAAAGSFDFIICHGVFSWVGPGVQEKILSICRENLAPDGIAYISYNTYPGWHFRNMLRDMVQFHVREGDSTEETTRRSLELVKLLAGANAGSQHPYAMYLQTARALLETATSPGYFVHEYLEPTNEPILFRDFARRAAKQKLQYVCEADATAADLDHFPPPLATKIRGLSPDRLDREQYIDFTVGRTFRRTLLAHAGRAMSVSIDPKRIRSLSLRSNSKAPHPLITALAEAWPDWMSFEELKARAGVEDWEIEKTLPSLFVTGHIELRL
jgi:SAM-dependent methyltransferase